MVTVIESIDAGIISQSVRQSGIHSVAQASQPGNEGLDGTDRAQCRVNVFGLAAAAVYALIGYWVAVVMR